MDTPLYTPFHTPFDTQRQIVKRTQTSTEDTGKRKTKAETDNIIAIDDGRQLNGCGSLENRNKIVVFPFSKRRAIVLHVARTFLSKGKTGREAYWREQVSMATRRLRRLGLDASVIDDCIADLRSAVEAELWRMTTRRGGAA